MSNQKLIVFQGLPASGKTTKAKQMVEESKGQIKRVNKDDLREMIDCSKWSKEREQHIINIRDLIIGYYLDNGYSVISDDTNLAPKHIIRLQEIADSYDIEYVVNSSFCKVSYRECIERDLARKDKPSVGKDVIVKMYRQFLEEKIEKPLHNPYLSNCILVDIDGTLAIHKYRSPYEYYKCIDDKLNKPVAQLVFDLKKLGLEVIYVTGRENIYYEDQNQDVLSLTYKWLDKHNLIFGDNQKIYIREEKDHRSDHIVKKEIYENHIENKYNVQYVLDDRRQVIDMWRQLGLTCLDVAGHDW